MLKETVPNFWKKQAVYYFSWIMLFSLAVRICLLILHKGAQLDLYFGVHRAGDDFFADFLNPVRYSLNRDPFFDETFHPKWHNQSALYYLYSWILARISRAEFGGDRGAWGNGILMLHAYFFCVFSIFVLGHSLYCLLKKFEVSPILILPMLLSGPVFFSIERGSSVIISAACVVYFVSFYDSENEKLKFFACFCLAMAAALKIYPVLFGMLYFEKKQFKEIVVCAMMALTLFFAPFFFLKHGVENIGRMLWIESFWASQAYNNQGFTAVAEKVLCALFLIMSLFQKKIFNRLLCITFSFFRLTAFQSEYLLLYFLPLLALIFSKSDKELYSANLIYKVFFFIYFGLLFSPLQVAKYIYKTVEFNRNSHLYFIGFKYIFVFFFFTILFENLISAKKVRFGK